jgi:hypothetical protein
MSTAGQEIAIRQISFVGGGGIYRTPKGAPLYSAFTEGTWPMARLTLRDDGIALRVLFSRAWFPRENVRHLEIEPRWLGGAIRIVPCREEAGEFYRFTTFRLQRIVPYLLAFRYAIREQSRPHDRQGPGQGS